MAGRSQLFALTAAVLAVGGCSLEERPSEKSAPKASTQEQPVPPGRPLPAGWYQDPDRDFVSTAVEQEVGSDPAVDECARELDCPGISEDTGVVRPEQGVNTMMVLDSSGSMRADAGGERKIDAAEEALERFATGTPDRYDLGLVVYGHVGSSAEADKERSCAGVDTAGRLGEVNYRNLSDTLDRYEPRGYTPIAGSIKEAGKAFDGREDDVNRVVLVTDGLETCDGDPVAAARRLKESGVRVTVDVVGFDIAQSADAQALRDIAEASGGDYTDARTADELDAFVEAEERRQRELNEAESCLLSRGNELYNCYTSRSNSAYNQATSRSNAIYNDTTSESNRIYNELTSESNRIYNDLTSEANDASAQGDEERAQEIENRRDKITEEIERRRDTQTEALEGRRDEVTEEIERLRDEAETAIVAEREREEGENARLRAELEREAEEVERRLEKRYGRASVLETEPYACLPRVFGPLAAAPPRPGALFARPMA